MNRRGSFSLRCTPRAAWRGSPRRGLEAALSRRRCPRSGTRPARGRGTRRGSRRGSRSRRCRRRGCCAASLGLGQRLLRGVIGRRLRAADQLDDLHYGHGSSSRDDRPCAAGGGVLSRRVPPCVAADLPGGDPLLERRAQPRALGRPGVGGPAPSRPRNCSSAATIAAASESDAAGETISMLGRGAFACRCRHRRRL